MKRRHRSTSMPSTAVHFLDPGRSPSPMAVLCRPLHSMPGEDSETMLGLPQRNSSSGQRLGVRGGEGGCVV